MDYPEVFSRLATEAAMVLFIKRDGKFRLMLATRNPRIPMFGGADHLGLALNAHDKKNSIQNGNISVIDLTIDDVRAFNINRVVKIQWLGTINTHEEYEKLMSEYLVYSKQYNESKPESISMDMLTGVEE